MIYLLESHSDEVLQTLALRAEIKKMALTLYLGESDLVSFIFLIETVMQNFDYVLKVFH